MDTARLARTLGTLLHNGVPLLTALSIAKNVMGNTALSQAVDEAAKDVKTGGGLAPSLAKSKRFRAWRCRWSQWARSRASWMACSPRSPTPSMWK
jgi:type II secretory pathway component PulF